MKVLHLLNWKLDSIKKELPQIQKQGFMKSDIDLFVINRIKEKRKELNVSQRGMAAILDCTAGFIGQVESENSAFH